MAKTLKILTMIVALAFCFTAEAQEKEKAKKAPVKKEAAKKKTKQAKAEASNEAPQKVDVENLEKRYWAPKDKKFKVVQNRTYTKTKKVSLSLMPALMLNEEYSEGFGFTAAVGYYFNDRWGVEAEYQAVNLDDNDLQNAVIKEGGFANHGKVTDYMGVSARFMPFYAKMSWLGSKIVYFDLSFGLTAGVTGYEQQYDPVALAAGRTEDRQTAFTYGFDVSQSFYLSKKFLVRVDYKHRFFTEDLVEGAGAQNAGDSAGDRLEDTLSLNLGLTYLF